MKRQEEVYCRLSSIVVVDGLLLLVVGLSVHVVTGSSCCFVHVNHNARRLRGPRRSRQQDEKRPCPGDMSFQAFQYSLFYSLFTTVVSFVRAQ